MKKLKSKIVSFALALCLIVPCMFTLTACGDDHTHTYASTWTYNMTHHWKAATCGHSTEKIEYAEHELTDNVCACGYVAYTVTNGDEWNEVFTGDYLNDGTIITTNDVYENDVVDPLQRQTITMKSTENSMEMTITGGDEGTQFIIKQGDVWIGLVQAGGTWYGREQSLAEVESYSFAGSQGASFVDKFAEFEYDEENHCYVANNIVIEEGVDDEPDQVADYVKIYIEKGKLVKMEIKMTTSAENYMVSESVFSDYGTTVINGIPDEWTLMPAA